MERKTTINVVDTISGSHCVIFFNRDTYIDCKKRGDFETEMEVVVQGFLKQRHFYPNAEAPEEIIKYIKEVFLPVYGRGWPGWAS